jgi:hypothetical protein
LNVKYKVKNVNGKSLIECKQKSLKEYSLRLYLVAGAEPYPPTGGYL